MLRFACHEVGLGGMKLGREVTVSSYDMEMKKNIMDSEKLQRWKGQNLFIYSFFYQLQLFVFSN